MPLFGKARQPTANLPYRQPASWMARYETQSALEFESKKGPKILRFQIFQRR